MCNVKNTTCLIRLCSLESWFRSYLHSVPFMLQHVESSSSMYELKEVLEVQEWAVHGTKQANLTRRCWTLQNISLIVMGIWNSTFLHFHFDCKLIFSSLSLFYLFSPASINAAFNTKIMFLNNFGFHYTERAVSKRSWNLYNNTLPR